MGVQLVRVDVVDRYRGKRDTAVGIVYILRDAEWDEPNAIVPGAGRLEHAGHGNKLVVDRGGRLGLIWDD